MPAAGGLCGACRRPRSAALEDLHVVADAVADFRQGLLQRLLDLVVGALPRSEDDHFPTLLGGKAQPGMTGTDAVVATAFATMLANQAGGLFMGKVAVGSPIGELPLLVGVFELRQLIAGLGGDFPGVDTLPDGPVAVVGD